MFATSPSNCSCLQGIEAASITSVTSTPPQEKRRIGALIGFAAFASIVFVTSYAQSKRIRRSRPADWGRERADRARPTVEIPQESMRDIVFGRGE